jgi:hypothetical protein
MPMRVSWRGSCSRWSGPISAGRFGPRDAPLPVPGTFVNLARGTLGIARHIASIWTHWVDKRRGGVG